MPSQKLASGRTVRLAKLGADHDLYGRLVVFRTFCAPIQIRKTVHDDSRRKGIVTSPFDDRH